MDEIIRAIDGDSDVAKELRQRIAELLSQLAGANIECHKTQERIAELEDRNAKLEKDLKLTRVISNHELSRAQDAEAKLARVRDFLLGYEEMDRDDVDELTAILASTAMPKEDR